MPWKKGQSGNPKGVAVGVRMPRTSTELDLRKLAQALTRPALATTAAIMRNRDNPPAVRLAAAELIMKRGHGNPPTVHQNPDGTALNFNEMSTDDLRAGLRRLEAALGNTLDMPGTTSSNSGPASLAH
jgi:hypothetical protein